jgi:hypothetical protein
MKDQAMKDQAMKDQAMKDQAMKDHVSMPCATKTKMGNKTILRKMIMKKNEKKG